MAAGPVRASSNTESGREGERVVVGECSRSSPLLAEVKGSRGALLSGGEQQVPAIACALVKANPRLLLLDELSEGLAPRVVETLVEQLKTVQSAGW